MLTPAPTPTFIGAFPVILGVFFMVNARTEIIDIMAPGSIPKGNKDESFFQGVMVHYMFILGIALHASGVTNLALCLGFPGELAMIPLFTTVATMILFMAISRTGIAGAPQFSFPPVPGVVMLPTILATLSYNAYTNWASYGLTAAETKLFAALNVAPVVITQASARSAIRASSAPRTLVTPRPSDVWALMKGKDTRCARAQGRSRGTGCA